MGTGTPKEPVAPPVPGTAPHTLATQEAKNSIEPQNTNGPALRRLFLISRSARAGLQKQAPLMNWHFFDANFWGVGRKASLFCCDPRLAHIS